MNWEQEKAYCKKRAKKLKTEMEAAVAASDEEDKDKICKLLCKVLQLTRGVSDLKSLDFNPDSEIVTAVFEGGSRTINVACDSGTAMIRDIMNHLEC